MSTLTNNYQAPLSTNRAYYTAAGYGGAAGILMGCYLLLTGDYITGFHPGIALSKYLILGTAIALFLNWFKSVYNGEKIFRKGMKYGLFTTVVSAVTLAVFSLIASSFYHTETTGNYFLNDGSSDLQSGFTLAGVTFFECFVAGMILTFIWLQLFKGNNATDH